MNEMRVARLRCGKNLWCCIQSRERKLPFCMVLEVSAEGISRVFGGGKMPSSLRGGLRDDGDISQEYQRFFDQSHKMEGGKTQKS